MNNVYIYIYICTTLRSRNDSSRQTKYIPLVTYLSYPFSYESVLFAMSGVKQSNEKTRVNAHNTTLATDHKVSSAYNNIGYCTQSYCIAAAFIGVLQKVSKKCALGNWTKAKLVQKQSFFVRFKRDIHSPSTQRETAYNTAYSCQLQEHKPIHIPWVWGIPKLRCPCP